MKTELSYITISGNEVSFQNEYPFSFLTGTDTHEVPAGHTIFFEDAGIYPLTIIESENYASVFRKVIVGEPAVCDDATNRVVVDQQKEMAALREQCCAKIDAKAEQIRGIYITLGSGQALVYMEKRREAEAYLADTSIDTDLIPHLALESTARGMTVESLADEVIATSNAWRDMSAAIEAIRLGAKTDIANATTLATILSTYEAVDWSSVEP